MHDTLPDFTSLERKIKDREGKMYLDLLQNHLGATIACAYSLRLKPSTTASMPALDRGKERVKDERFYH